MYLTTDRYRTGYDRYGSQRASGMFLILVTDQARAELRPPLRAVVRKVNMSQLGQFMMGTATIGGQAFTLSGTYGHDGLTLDVPAEIFEQCVELPPELAEAFWTGGGHNGAGAEGPALRAWAIQNLRRLHRAGRDAGASPSLKQGGHNDADHR